MGERKRESERERKRESGREKEGEWERESGRGNKLLTMSSSSSPFGRWIAALQHSLYCCQTCQRKDDYILNLHAVPVCQIIVPVIKIYIENMKALLTNSNPDFTHTLSKKLLTMSTGTIQLLTMSIKLQ